MAARGGPLLHVIERDIPRRRAASCTASAGFENLRPVRGRRTSCRHADLKASASQD